MNGSKGRAKTLAAIRRRRDREAAAAGIDVSDRAAVRKFFDAKLVEIHRRITEKE